MIGKTMELLPIVDIPFKFIVFSHFEEGHNELHVAASQFKLREEILEWLEQKNLNHRVGRDGKGYFVSFGDTQSAVLFKIKMTEWVETIKETVKVYTNHYSVAAGPNTAGGPGSYFYGTSGGRYGGGYTGGGGGTSITISTQNPSGGHGYTSGYYGVTTGPKFGFLKGE